MPRPYRKLGVAASRVRAVAGPGEGSGWRRAGKGTEPGEVRPGDLLPAGGPRTLEDTQGIHHHLLGVRVLGSRYTHHKTFYHRQHDTGINETQLNVMLQLKVELKNAGATLLYSSIVT